MKKRGIILVLSWLIFGISMAWIGEYIVSRPVDGLIQLTCILVGPMLAVVLIKQTADFFNTFLKND